MVKRTTKPTKLSKEVVEEVKATPAVRVIRSIRSLWHTRVVLNLESGKVTIAPNQTITVGAIITVDEAEALASRVRPQKGCCGAGTATVHMFEATYDEKYS